MSKRCNIENGVSPRSSCLGAILGKSKNSDSESRKLLNQSYNDKNSFSTIDYNDELYTRSNVDGKRGSTKSKKGFKKFPLCNNKAVTCKRLKDYSASVYTRPSYELSIARKGHGSSRSCNTDTAQTYEIYGAQMKWSRSDSQPQKFGSKRNDMITRTSNSYESANTRKMAFGNDRLQRCTDTKKKQNSNNKKDEYYRCSVANTSRIHRKFHNSEKLEKYNAVSRRTKSMDSVSQYIADGNYNVSHRKFSYEDNDDFLNTLMNDFTITEKNRRSNETFLDDIQESLMKDRLEEERKLTAGVPSLVSIKNYTCQMDEENKALMNELENLTDCVDSFLDSAQSPKRCVIDQSGELLSLQECQRNNSLFNELDDIYPSIDNSSAHLENGEELKKNVLLDELEEISKMVVEIPTKSSFNASRTKIPPPISHSDSTFGLDEKIKIGKGWVNLSDQDKDNASTTKLSGEEKKRRRDALYSLRNGNDESRKDINLRESFGNETKLDSPTNGIEYDQLEKKTSQICSLEEDFKPSPINLFNDSEDELLLFANDELEDNHILSGRQHVQRIGIEPPPILLQ